MITSASVFVYKYTNNATQFYQINKKDHIGPITLIWLIEVICEI